MALINLVKMNKQEYGIVRQIDESKLANSSGLVNGEIEERLLEMGFIEGAKLEIMHLGIFGHDPIAVRINNGNSLIALRKNEASTIFLEKLG